MAFPWVTLALLTAVGTARWWVPLGPSPRPLPAEPQPTPVLLPEELERAAGGPIALGDRVVLRTTQGDITIVLFPSEAPTYTRHFLQEVHFGTFRSEGIWRRDPGRYVQLGSPDTDVDNAANTGRYDLLPNWFDHNRLPLVAGSVVMNKRFEDEHGRMVRHEYAIITGAGGYFPGTVIGHVIDGLEAAGRLQTGDAIAVAVDVTEP